MSTSTPPPEWARRLAYAGLLPFVFCAALVWWVEPQRRWLCGLILADYAAVIAGFLGALHWGLMMREPQEQRASAWVWGVMPSLVGWLAVLIPAGLGLLVLTMLLWVCYGVDRRAYPRFGLQGWLPMRLALTLVASTCCLIGAMGVLR
jgi:hypothetical protein